MRMASKVLPSPPFIASPAISSTSAVPTNPPNTDPGGSAVKPESSYSVRAVPVKLYLPDGAPVLQDIISPHSADGMFAFFVPADADSRQTVDRPWNVTTSSSAPVPSYLNRDISHRISNCFRHRFTAPCRGGVASSLHMWRGWVAKNRCEITRSIMIARPVRQPLLRSCQDRLDFRRDCTIGKCIVSRISRRSRTETMVLDRRQSRATHRMAVFS